MANDALFPSFPGPPPPPPPLPAWGEAAGPEPEVVQAADVLHTWSHGIELLGFTREGSRAGISLFLEGEGLACVELRPGAAPSPRTKRSPAEEAAAPRVETAPGRVRIATPEITVEATLEPFRLSFLGPGGKPLLAQDREACDALDRRRSLPFGFTRAGGRIAACHDAFSLAPTERLYGTGERFCGPDLRGRCFTLWNTDAYGAHGPASHKNVPFVVSSRGYGVHLDTFAPARLDLGASHHGAWSAAVPGDRLRYRVIAAPDLPGVVSRFTRLTGRPRLPPKWALGLWCSGGFVPERGQDVLDRARRIRKLGIPCDVIHLDCYWQRFGRWSEMAWDREAFPDPEGLVRALEAMGFRVSLWINPYLSVESERFHEAEAEGFLLRRVSGETLVEPLWGEFHPPVGIVDFTRPEAAAWFQDLLRPHLRMGVDAFKTDFGEGVPPEAVCHAGIPGLELHNRYALLYNEAVRRVVAEERGGPGTVFARASWAGGQGLGIHWSGDPGCTFPEMASTLRAGLHLGCCGHAFWTHDMGGFHGTPDPELFLRWSQFGLLSPCSRLHGRTPRLPWAYGEEVLRLFRAFARLRYRLLPYLYTCAVEAAEQGLPILRSMALGFPEDPAAAAADLQYLLGPALLVAPLFEPGGRRSVYLPPGGWFEWFTGAYAAGPCFREATAPLDRLPLYVREGTLLPLAKPKAHLEEGPFPEITFQAFFHERGAFTLRDTDGTLEVEAIRTGRALRVTAAGPGKPLGFLWPGRWADRSVETMCFQGAPLPFRPPEELPFPRGPGGWTREADGTIRATLLFR